MSLVRNPERLRPHGQSGPPASNAIPSNTAKPTVRTRTAGMKPDQKTDRRTFLKQGASPAACSPGAGAAIAGCGDIQRRDADTAERSHRRPAGPARRTERPRPYGGRTSS